MRLTKQKKVVFKKHLTELFDKRFLIYFVEKRPPLGELFQCYLKVNILHY